jgi:hypothetical protein
MEISGTLVLAFYLMQWKWITGQVHTLYNGPVKRKTVTNFVRLLVHCAKCGYPYHSLGLATQACIIDLLKGKKIFII